MAKINVKAAIPIALTAFGIVGTIITVANCQKDTVKAMKKLEEAEIKIETKKEKFQYVWKCYIPTMVSGGVTILSIAAAGYLNHKTEMALAAALALNKDNLKKFELKAKEIIGEDKVQEIKQEVAKENVRHVDIPKEDIEQGHIRLYDPYSEQFLDTTPEKLSLSMLGLNHDLACGGGAAYNKFLRLNGGKISRNLDLLGWSFGNDIQDWNWSFQDGYWLKFQPGELVIDGQPIQSVNFNVNPEVQGLDYDR